MSDDIERKKRDALRVHCLWSWLERNPGKDKELYPLFYELGIHECSNECPWCECYLCMDFVPTFINENCKGCPLFRAGEQCIDNDDEDSLYFVWAEVIDDPEPSKNDIKMAAIAAGDIANIAWEEYKRLGG